MSVVVGTVASAVGTASSDAQLVALVRSGDDGAFEELYRRYAARLRGFVTRRVGDPARAEDLTQDAFMSALRGLRSSDAEIKWKPWLFEIARNATIDFHRRRGRAAVELPVEPDALRPLDQLRLAAPDAPDADLDAKERLDHLRAAFDELSAQEHRVLVMRELEGRSYREIAERMKLTLGAVQSSLFRGRRRLEVEYAELAAGRRCTSARAVVALLAEGAGAASDRRRLARHARRCGSCRLHARELGVEPFAHRRLQRRVAGFLPLGAASGHLGGNSLAERATALVAAGAMACAGTVSLGLDPADRAPSTAPRAAPAVRAAPAPTAQPRSRHAPLPSPQSRVRAKPHPAVARHPGGASLRPTAPRAGVPVKPASPPQPEPQQERPTRELSAVVVVKQAVPVKTPPPADLPRRVTETVDSVAAAPGNVGLALPG
jgi:RNA polymerase sigma factor (sigma-70 family)